MTCRNESALNNFIASATDLKDLRLIEKYITHGKHVITLDKTLIRNLKNLLDTVLHPFTPDVEHYEGIMSILKCLEHHCNHNNDGQDWDLIHNEYIDLITGCLHYVILFLENDKNMFLLLWTLIVGVLYNSSTKHPNVKNAMLKVLSPILLGVALNHKLSLTQRKECLRVIIHLQAQSDRELRRELLRNIHNDVSHLFDLLATCGDYETQLVILETVLRFATVLKYRNSFCNFLNCDPQIQEAFLNISFMDFDADCRKFLNMFNFAQGKNTLVFTIACVAVRFGKKYISQPKDAKYEKFWIDFNLGSGTVIILCDRHSLVIDEKISQDNGEWELVTISNHIVRKVSLRIRKDQGTQYKELKLALSQPFEVSHESSVACSHQSQNVYLLFVSSSRMKDLEESVLPSVFKYCYKPLLQENDEISHIPFSICKKTSFVSSSHRMPHPDSVCVKVPLWKDSATNEDTSVSSSVSLSTYRKRKASETKSMVCHMKPAYHKQFKPLECVISRSSKGSSNEGSLMKRMNQRTSETMESISSIGDNPTLQAMPIKMQPILSQQLLNPQVLELNNSGKDIAVHCASSRKQIEKFQCKQVSKESMPLQTAYKEPGSYDTKINQGECASIIKNHIAASAVLGNSSQDYMQKTLKNFTGACKKTKLFRPAFSIVSSSSDTGRTDLSTDFTSKLIPNDVYKKDINHRDSAVLHTQFEISNNDDNIDILSECAVQDKSPKIVRISEELHVECEKLDTNNILHLPKQRNTTVIKEVTLANVNGESRNVGGSMVTKLNADNGEVVIGDTDIVMEKVSETSEATENKDNTCKNHVPSERESCNVELATIVNGVSSQRKGDKLLKNDVIVPAKTVHGIHEKQNNEPFSSQHSNINIPSENLATCRKSQEFRLVKCIEKSIQNNQSSNNTTDNNEMVNSTHENVRKIITRSFTALKASKRNEISHKNQPIPNDATHTCEIAAASGSDQIGGNITTIKVKEISKSNDPEVDSCQQIPSKGNQKQHSKSCVTKKKVVSSKTRHKSNKRKKVSSKMSSIEQRRVQETTQQQTCTMVLRSRAIKKPNEGICYNPVKSKEVETTDVKNDTVQVSKKAEDIQSANRSTYSGRSSVKRRLFSVSSDVNMLLESNTNAINVQPTLQKPLHKNTSLSHSKDQVSETSDIFDKLLNDYVAKHKIRQMRDDNNESSVQIEKPVLRKRVSRWELRYYNDVKIQMDMPLISSKDDKSVFSDFDSDHEWRKAQNKRSKQHPVPLNIYASTSSSENEAYSTICRNRKAPRLQKKLTSLNNSKINLKNMTDKNHVHKTLTQNLSETCLPKTDSPGKVTKGNSQSFHTSRKNKQLTNSNTKGNIPNMLLNECSVKDMSLENNEFVSVRYIKPMLSVQSPRKEQVEKSPIDMPNIDNKGECSINQHEVSFELQLSTETSIQSTNCDALLDTSSNAYSSNSENNHVSSHEKQNSEMTIKKTVGKLPETKSTGNVDSVSNSKMAEGSSSKTITDLEIVANYHIGSKDSLCDEGVSSKDDNGNSKKIAGSVQRNQLFDTNIKEVKEVIENDLLLCDAGLRKQAVNDTQPLLLADDSITEKGRNNDLHEIDQITRKCIIFEECDQHKQSDPIKLASDSNSKCAIEKESTVLQENEISLGKSQESSKIQISKKQQIEGTHLKSVDSDNFSTNSALETDSCISKRNFKEAQSQNMCHSINFTTIEKPEVRQIQASSENEVIFHLSDEICISLHKNPSVINSSSKEETGLQISTERVRPIVELSTERPVDKSIGESKKVASNSSTHIDKETNGTPGCSQFLYCSSPPSNISDIFSLYISSTSKEMDHWKKSFETSGTQSGNTKSRENLNRSEAHNPKGDRYSYQNAKKKKSSNKEDTECEVMDLNQKDSAKFEKNILNSSDSVSCLGSEVSLDDIVSLSQQSTEDAVVCLQSVDNSTRNKGSISIGCSTSKVSKETQEEEEVDQEITQIFSRVQGVKGNDSVKPRNENNSFMSPLSLLENFAPCNVLFNDNGAKEMAERTKYSKGSDTSMILSSDEVAEFCESQKQQFKTSSSQGHASDVSGESDSDCNYIPKCSAKVNRKLYKKKLNNSKTKKIQHKKTAISRTGIGGKHIIQSPDFSICKTDKISQQMISTRTSAQKAHLERKQNWVQTESHFALKNRNEKKKNQKLERTSFCERELHQKTHEPAGASFHQSGFNIIQIEMAINEIIKKKLRCLEKYSQKSMEAIGEDFRNAYMQHKNINKSAVSTYEKDMCLKMKEIEAKIMKLHHYEEKLVKVHQYALKTIEQNRVEVTHIEEHLSKLRQELEKFKAKVVETNENGASKYSDTRESLQDHLKKIIHQQINVEKYNLMAQFREHIQAFLE